MFYTVTFNPALDYVMRLPALLPGQVNRAQSEALMPGGKGINVSLILRALGVDSTALGFVAGHTGSLLRRWLRQAGIAVDFVDLPAGETRINVKISAGEETELNGIGPPVPSEFLELLLGRLERLSPGDTLILSGSVSAAVPEDVYAQALSRLPQGVRAVVDAEGELLRQCLPFHPFLIKPNLRELGALCAFTPQARDTEAVVRCARSLQDQGARNVLVSLGAEGALLLTQAGDVMTQASAQGVQRNATGAGDSMVAGFLTGFDRSGYREALRLGAAAGGATAFSPRLATGEEIDQVYAALL